MTNRYCVRIERWNGWSESVYLGGDSRAAWDTFRKHSAMQAITKHRPVWLQTFDPAMSGIGGWRTVHTSNL